MRVDLLRRLRQRSDTVRRRVYLRPLDDDRARQVLAHAPASGDRWADGYPSSGDVEAAVGTLSMSASKVDDRGFGSFEVLLDDEIVIGGIGFHGPPDALGAVEVGYGIVESERNRGYATTALKLVIARAFELGAAAVIARADPANNASRRVMEKAGMSQRGFAGYLALYRIEHDRLP